MRCEQEIMMPTQTLRRLALIAGAATLAAVGVPALAGKAKSVDHHSGAAMPTIVGAAVANPDFSTLVAAVQAAGLVDTLNSAGPFTVFAPTNAAFNALPAGTVDTLLRPENRAQLTRVLTYHVIAGRASARDIRTAIRRGRGTASFTTVAGERITATHDRHGNLVLVDQRGGRSTVRAADLNQSNGVIHVIDRVVLPR
jgi:uncharacterized surface protein with fasciclin (FAS1) repeats